MTSTNLTPREYVIEEKNAPLLITTIHTTRNIPAHVDPTFTQQDRITGDVKLILAKPQSIKDVIFIVRGKVVYGSYDSDVGPRILWFYERKKTLWAREEGQPTNSNSPDTPSQVPSTTISSGKLLGTYIWNFSIAFPPPSQLLRLRPTNGKPDENPDFKLPHTFREAFNRASVVYHVFVEVHRGGFSSDKELIIPINYVPVVTPPPIPHLHQIAYQDGYPLPSPYADPVGWTAVETVHIRGKLFQQRSVDVACTLYIGNPLCYTRGSVIPLYMELEGDDSQALDILASPKAPFVRLKRMVNSHPQTTSRISFKVLTNYSYPAVWWSTASDELPTSGADLGSSKRTLRGEIHLKSNLMPTSSVGHFWIEYSVILLPSKITGFETAELNSEKHLVEKRVEIATAYAPGARPKRMAPMSYDAAQDELQTKDMTLRNKITL